ncbi:General transcription factor IIIC [Mactra antiquata]
MADKKQNDRNPFLNLGRAVSDDQLQTWQQMNEQVRGLVQMSDDDDIDEVIDDSLLITDMTADSIAFDVPVPVEPVPGPSTSGHGQIPSTSKIVSNMSSNMELTLQYLSGKISLLEFSELMEQENDTVTVDDGIETTVVEVVIEPSTETKDKIAETEVKPKRKKLKNRRKKHDLPPLLESAMGEVNMTFAQGKYQEAIEQCLEIVRQAPDASKPFQTLAMIYEDMGDVQKSLQYALIASYLAPNDCEEWARLAEICIEQNDIDQAIKCYTQAIQVNGANKNHCLWERSQLYESIKEHKKALDGYHTLLSLLSNVDSEKYFKLAWGITRTYYEQGEKQRAIDTMNKAFKEHPDQITSEDVNLFLELLIPEKRFFMDCLKIFVEHCGIIFTFLGGRQWSDQHPVDLDYLDQYTMIRSFQMGPLMWPKMVSGQHGRGHCDHTQPKVVAIMPV